MADKKNQAKPEETLEELQAKNPTKPEETLEELQAKIKLQEEIIAEQNAGLGKLEATVSKLAPKAAANTKAPIVKVDDKSYNVVSNAIIPGKGKMTAEEIAEDAELCVHLVSIQSGVLRAVGE